MKKILFACLISCIYFPVIKAQVVFESVTKTTVYDYLDEMANLKLIELNSCIKPYTRQFIAEKLVEVEAKKDKLNKRQKGELTFFMRDYSKELKISPQRWDWLGRKVLGRNRVPFSQREKRVDLIYHKDSLLTFSLNPILGANFYYSTTTGLTYQRWNGADMFAYVGKHLGIYANLRDNYLSSDIASPGFLNQISGSQFKFATIGFTNRNAREYSEMRGGLTYGWKWGHLGIIKESNVWGNNYNGSNILSNRGPSYAQIKLNIKPAKWIEFNYFHGWLSSKVADSSSTQNYGTGISTVFVPKYLAMNMITVKPFKTVHLSFGNSMVYSRNINAGYLIPFMFFKALDYTYSSLGNSALFFDISVRSIRKVHLYASAYLDELSISRMRDKERHSNFWSGKAGIRLSNVIPNVTITAEYTITNPLAYKHYNPETTYENAGFNMGHYLRDNAQDAYLQIAYKPLPRLSLSAFYNYASKGPDYVDNRTLKNPATGQYAVWGLKFQESLIWESTTMGGQISYELLNDVHIRVGAQYANVWDPSGKYTPKAFSGKQLSTNCTLTWGF